MDTTLTNRLHRGHIIGYIAGLVPFFFFCGAWSVERKNGVVVSSSYFDVVALLGGLIALASVIVTFAVESFPDDPSRKRAWLLLSAGLIVLGGLQLARAFGIFWQPPT